VDLAIHHISTKQLIVYLLEGLIMKWPFAVLSVLTYWGLPALVVAANSDWPGYNRTLTSERFSPLSAVNVTNAGQLKVVCSYDTGQLVSFQTGLIQVDGALFATTEHDTMSLDPNTCKENWRVHEEFPPGYMKVNRGLAWLDGRVYRGTADGRVLAYDAKSGGSIWKTTIADSAKGESVPAAPIAWAGMVFIGMAGGDNKGVKGRMYAVDAKDGHIVWEFYMVPKSPQDITRGPQAPIPPALSLTSWKSPAGIPISGGGTWTSYSLDPETGVLYVPGGNPAPDFASGPRQGKNLFANSSVRTPLPILSGTTPTAGGVLFFGDMGGNFYVFDAKSGSKLWSINLGGALAGGVITYDTGVGQKIAVAAGMTSPIWPTQKVNGKVVVLGL